MTTPLLIAHRGGAAETPENTLAAFRHALDMGIRMFELDVQLSQDGVPVVIHDETLDRTTDGSGEVGALTYEELRRLDAGSWFGEEWKGEPVPTLREVLELCASQAAGALVELKSPHLYAGIEAKVAALLGEMWMRGAHDFRCISFDHEAVRRLRALDPALPLGYLYYPWAAEFALPDDTVGAVCPFYATAAQRPDQVARAHELGKLVFVWTVNRAEEIREAAMAGVDGIISDHPSLLLDVFGRGRP